MKKLHCFSNKKLWAIVAVLAILAPSLVSAGGLNPVLDTAGLYQVANKTTSGSWGTSVNASPGQTLSLMVHIHNGIVDSVAKNVKVSATLPSDAVVNYQSKATVSADNASSVSANADIHLSENAKIEYIPGSTVMYNHMSQVEKNLPDGITTGGITVLPELKGCWEYERWVKFQAKVVEVPKPVKVQIKIVKFNDLDGDKIKDENESYLAGWQFKVTGTGFSQTVTTGQNGVALLDNLPEGTYTVTEILQSGWENTTGVTVTKNVTCDPASQSFVFGNKKVKIPTCEDESEKNKPECQTPTPVPTPTPTPTLPATGPGDMAAMFLGSLSISGGTLSYLRSKKNLKKASLKR